MPVVFLYWSVTCFNKANIIYFNRIPPKLQISNDNRPLTSQSFSLFLWWLKITTVILSHSQKHTHTKGWGAGGEEKGVGGTGWEEENQDQGEGGSSGQSLLWLEGGAVHRSQLVFVVAELGEGHFPAELHHLPEHLLRWKHRAGRQQQVTWWSHGWTGGLITLSALLKSNF